MKSYDRSMGPWAVSAVSCMLLAGCGESGGPNPPPELLNLAVTVEVDSARFRTQGEVILNLVPSDSRGRAFLTEDWAITTGLTTPTSVAVALASHGVELADTQPVAAAILIDDSGSLRFTDPDRDRAAAAQLFWTDILAARPGNVVALLDFGQGSVEPSPGFEKATLLSGFTSDRSALDALLPRIEAQPGGGTPLYPAANEVVTWIDSTTPATYQRTLVLISDGIAGNTSFAAELFAQARASGVRIFAVGLASAAQQDPPTTAANLMKQIAIETGGIYGAAEPPQKLRDILLVLARSASPDRLLAVVRLDPIPPSGTAVAGTVGVSGQLGTATAGWSLVAP